MFIDETINQVKQIACTKALYIELPVSMYSLPPGISYMISDFIC